MSETKYGISDNIAATIELARGGDTGAFAKIVQQYQSLVSGVLFSATGDFHKSEDFTQETFLIAWQKLGELRSPDNLAAWLCTIARNLAHRAHRKPTLPTVSLDETGGLAPAAHAPDAELLRREQSEFVWSAIGEIDEKHRETLVLYYRSGQSVREIATATESTEDAVCQRLVRARQSLKAKIEEMVGDILTDTAPGEFFTMTVMTAIGATMLTTTTAQAAVAVTTGTVVTGGTTTGKVTGLAAFWSVIGPAAYALWCFSLFFISLWTAIRDAPTLNARRYSLYMSFVYCRSFLLVCFGCGIVFACVMMLFTWITSSRYVGGWLCLVTYFVILLVFSVFLQRRRNRYRDIIKTDLGIAETPANSYSYAEVARCIHSALFINLLAILTVFGLVLILPLFDGSSGVLPVLATIGVAACVGLLWYGYCRFGIYLLESCCTESGLQNMPPLIDRAFETALGRSAWKPDDLPSERLPAWLKFWSWGGAVLVATWYALWLDWTIRPIPTALCFAAILAAFTIGNMTWVKRLVRISKRALFLCTALFFFVIAFLIMALVLIQCDTLSPFLLWQQMDWDSHQYVILGTLMFSSILFIFGGLLSIIRYFWGSRPEKLRRDEEYDERIRQAIERYQPKVAADLRAAGVVLRTDTSEHLPTEFPSAIADQPPGGRLPTSNGIKLSDEHLTPPFPKHWLRILCWYGVAIIVLFCIAALIPNPYAHKKMLERNHDYTALIALEPDNAEWYYMRGIYARDGADTIADFDTAIKLKPDYAKAYWKRAQARNRLSNREDSLLALDDINAAIRLESEPYYFLVRADIYEHLDDLEAAEKEYSEAIRLKPDWSFYSIRGYFYHKKKKDFPKALADYTTAIQLAEQEKNVDPAVPAALYRDRGQLYEQLGEPAKVPTTPSPAL